MGLLFALASAVVIGGIVMFIAWFRPAPAKARRRRRGLTLTQRWERLDKRMRITIVVGLIAGVLVAVITRLPAMVLAVPAAIIGLPLLLGKPQTRERDQLAALEVWARSLAAAAETGAFTLPEVIGITRGSAPDILRGPVDRLYARMTSTWSPSRSLREFASELNSDSADEVVVYLIQATEYSAGGLAKALSSVADALKQQEKLQTEVYFEREKPRRSLTMMTWIAGATLGIVIIASGTVQMAFYRTPLGGFVMAVLLGLFVLTLVWAKATVRTKPPARVLLTSEEVPA